MKRTIECYLARDYDKSEVKIFTRRPSENIEAYYKLGGSIGYGKTYSSSPSAYLGTLANDEDWTCVQPQGCVKVKLTIEEI